MKAPSGMESATPADMKEEQAGGPEYYCRVGKLCVYSLNRFRECLAPFSMFTPSTGAQVLYHWQKFHFT